jgi:tetratricopeptide (TPR) repeat protein
VALLPVFQAHHLPARRAALTLVARAPRFAPDERDHQGDQGLLLELAEAYEKVAEVRGISGVANLGQAELAEQNMRKALALREQIDENLELTLRNLALIYRDLGDDAMTRKYFTRAIEVATRRGASRPVCVLDQVLGAIVRDDARGHVVVPLIGFELFVEVGVPAKERELGFDLD